MTDLAVFGDDVQVTQTGLVLSESLTFEKWEEIGEFLQTVERSIQWWIGDWLNYGEQKWGEMYSQAIQDELGEKYQTLANYKWVAKQVQFSMRMENLSWNHHQAVAKLPPDEQVEWLTKAEAEGLSYRDMARTIQDIGEGMTDNTPPSYIEVLDAMRKGTDDWCEENMRRWERDEWGLGRDASWKHRERWSDIRESAHRILNELKDKHRQQQKEKA